MRAPEIAFTCPHCGREATGGLDGRGHCVHCGRETTLEVTTTVRERGAVDRCPLCQGEQMYVQRDFNQKAGLPIVVVGAVLAPFTPYYSSLFVAAAVDAILYMLLPEIAICYRCGTHFRGFPRNPKHHAFDLHIAEQYGTPGSAKEEGRH
jgi:hypothetical protein